MCIQEFSHTHNQKGGGVLRATEELSLGGH